MSSNAFFSLCDKSCSARASREEGAAFAAVIETAEPVAMIDRSTKRSITFTTPPRGAVGAAACVLKGNKVFMFLSAVLLQGRQGYSCCEPSRVADSTFSSFVCFVCHFLLLHLSSLISSGSLCCSSIYYCWCCVSCFWLLSSLRRIRAALLSTAVSIGIAGKSNGTVAHKAAKTAFFAGPLSTAERLPHINDLRSTEENETENQAAFVFSASVQLDTKKVAKGITSCSSRFSSSFSLAEKSSHSKISASSKGGIFSERSRIRIRTAAKKSRNQHKSSHKSCDGFALRRMDADSNSDSNPPSEGSNRRKKQGSLRVKLCREVSFAGRTDSSWNGSIDSRKKRSSRHHVSKTCQHYNRCSKSTCSSRLKSKCTGRKIGNKVLFNKYDSSRRWSNICFSTMVRDTFSCRPLADSSHFFCTATNRHSSCSSPSTISFCAFSGSNSDSRGGGGDNLRFSRSRKISEVSSSSNSSSSSYCGTSYSNCCRDTLWSSTGGTSSSFRRTKGKRSKCIDDIGGPMKNLTHLKITSSAFHRSRSRNRCDSNNRSSRSWRKGLKHCSSKNKTESSSEGSCSNERDTDFACLFPLLRICTLHRRRLLSCIFISALLFLLEGTASQQSSSPLNDSTASRFQRATFSCTQLLPAAAVAASPAVVVKFLATTAAGAHIHSTAAIGQPLFAASAGRSCKTSSRFTGTASFLSPSFHESAALLHAGSRCHKMKKNKKLYVSSRSSSDVACSGLLGIGRKQMLLLPVRAATTAERDGLSLLAAADVYARGEQQQRIHGLASLLPGTGCRLVGVGSAVPSNILTNEDISQTVDTSDEWIRTRTGIASRRVLGASESIRDLAVLAARRALLHSQQQPPITPKPIETAGTAGKGKDASGVELDLLLLASSSPEDMFGDATSIAAALSTPQTQRVKEKNGGPCERDKKEELQSQSQALGGDEDGERRGRGATLYVTTKHFAAFDLTAACSGFLAGLITANALLTCESSPFKKILLVGADALSRWVDWNDRNSCILFGDGAGAVLLERPLRQQQQQQQAEPQQRGLLSYVLNSDGLQAGQLTLPFCGRQHTLKRALGKPPLVLSLGGYSPLQMNGKEVFKFVCKSVPPAIQAVVHAAGLRMDQVDWLLLHQANKRIMDAVADRLSLTRSKALCNLEKYGNTSAASIPLCLDEAVREGKVKPGDVIVTAGFGAGLTWSAAVFRYG